MASIKSNPLYTYNQVLDGIPVVEKQYNEHGYDVYIDVLHRGDYYILNITIATNGKKKLQ